jgi:hypothetical protein
MIENDFPVLRETVRESVIGRSVTWLAMSITAAAADAGVTQRLVAVRSSVNVAPAGAVRMGAIVIGVAAIAAWGLSKLIPLYVATAIPGAAFLAVAALSAITAMRAESVAEQWRSSRLRRLMT